MNKIQTAALEQSDEVQQGGLRRALFIALILSLVIPGIVAGLSMIYFNLQRTVVTEMHARAENWRICYRPGWSFPCGKWLPIWASP